MYLILFFFFQAEDGIRDVAVTGVQTCALPISSAGSPGCWIAGRTARLPGPVDALPMAPVPPAAESQKSATPPNECALAQFLRRFVLVRLEGGREVNIVRQS